MSQHPSIASHRAIAELPEHWLASYALLEVRLAQLTAELGRMREERVQQLALQESLTQRLKHLLDALPAAVVVIDGTGHVQEHNAAARLLLGEPLAHELWRNVISRIFEPHPPSGNELTLCDGRIVTLSTCPLGGGEPGQILMFQEVTELRRQQRQLEHQQRLVAMGRMAASLAHQVRTPLAAALLYASQLDRPDLAQEKRERFTARTLESLKGLEALVANMLDFARGGTSGEEVLVPAELLREVREQLEPQLSAGAVRCQLNIQTEGGELRGNRRLLVSALLNLAHNALQAMGGRGQLTLSLYPVADGRVDLAVEDDGPGVPVNIREQLFQPFTTAQPGGTGLGLSVVRAVARAHHGETWFRSEPGDTCFAMRLPLLGSSAAVPRTLRASA